MNLKLLGYGAALFVSMAVIKVLQHWDTMPFIKYEKMVTAIQIDVKSFTTDIAKLEIHNPNHYDIKDIDLTCTYFAHSGTELGSEKITVNVKLARIRTVSQRITLNIAKQTNSIKCIADDATILETVKGKIPKQYTVLELVELKKLNK